MRRKVNVTRALVLDNISPPCLIVHADVNDLLDPTEAAGSCGPGAGAAAAETDPRPPAPPAPAPAAAAAAAAAGAAADRLDCLLGLRDGVRRPLDGQEALAIGPDICCSLRHMHAPSAAGLGPDSLVPHTRDWGVLGTPVSNGSGPWAVKMPWRVEGDESGPCLATHDADLAPVPLLQLVHHRTLTPDDLPLVMLLEFHAELLLAGEAAAAAAAAGALVAAAHAAAAATLVEPLAVAHAAAVAAADAPWVRDVRAIHCRLRGHDERSVRVDPRVHGRLRPGAYSGSHFSST